MKDIKTIVNEEMQGMLNEVGDLLGIADLAEFLSRVSPNMSQENWQDALQDMYQQEGNEGVRKMFYELTKGSDLQILGRGKYALK